MAEETQNAGFDRTDFAQTLTDTSKDDVSTEADDPNAQEPEIEDFDEPGKKVESKIHVEGEPEGEPELDEFGKPKAKAPEPKPEDQMFKVKIYGEERQIPVKELIRGYQKAGASDRRFQEAAQRRQQVENWVQNLRQDPWQAFQLAGLDPVEQAERLVWDKYVEARMTPQQRAEWQARQRIAQAEAKLNFYEEQNRHVAAQQEAYRYTEYYTPVLEEAIDKYGVPETDYGRQKLIDALFQDLQDGIEPDAAALADRVNHDFAKELSVLKSLPPEQIQSLLGDETAKKLAQARAKSGRVRPGGKTVLERQPGSLTPKRNYVTPDEFDQAMERFKAKGE